MSRPSQPWHPVSFDVNYRRSLWPEARTVDGELGLAVEDPEVGVLGDDGDDPSGVAGADAQALPGDHDQLRRGDGDVPVSVNAANAVVTGALAWHPNGTVIAVTGGSGLITLLDVTTRSVTRVDTGRSWIRAVTWLADGRILITGDQDGVVRIWSVEAQESPAYDVQESESLPGRSVLVRAMAADEQAGRLAVAQGKSSVRVWQVTGDLRHHASVRPWRPAGPGYDSAGEFWTRVNSVRWSPDGATIAAGTATGAVLLFATSGRRTRHPDERAFTPPAWFGWPGTSLDLSGGEVRSIAWAPDARGLLVVDHSGALTLIDFDRGERRLISRDVSWENGQVTWSTDGHSAAVGGLENVQLWRTDSWQAVDRIRVAGHITGMAFAPHGGELAVAAGTDLLLIRLRDRVIRKIGGHEMGISGVRWSADVLACCGLDGTVSVYTPSGQLQHVFNGDQSAVLDVEVSADGGQVVAVTMNGSILCWETSTGRRTSGLAVDSQLLTCSLAPDGDRLSAGGAAGSYVLTRYRSGPLK
ncbi:WD40 repeat domain-containing protein [Amycolatopsis sp. NPDC024027]|uniref:WD40 repeat domain-containing protein n=1 Tax=Amycolatopsis sp. NPDC024027 TaxID=3154327 RepID=UPI0034107356